MSISLRKNQHIKLSKKSQVAENLLDVRFNYEPLISNHQTQHYSYRFLGQNIGAPIFLSSMTGGSRKSLKINKRIATAAKIFNLPMGVGSLRPYLENKNPKSFVLREFTGDKVLLFGNLGISQIEQLVNRDELFKIEKVIRNLDLDGLIIHINPLQEWVQKGGDLLKESPLITLEKTLPQFKTKIIVKEVGAGFGPSSLKELLKLPIDVIDLASFGGTNFTKLELLRDKNSCKAINSQPLINIGNSKFDMIKNVNTLLSLGLGKEKEFIVSGGVRDFLDGYYYTKLLNAPSLYGYAYKVLENAIRSQNHLNSFFTSEIDNFNFSQNFLRLNLET
ncbi:type 2 isopentenyl-diphosphate Delta-isomerase [Thiospirochaeta perfilievii]|uniref:Type 2 isopentenyl-diphosphate Delta-isomerase n=1 Tax=Thiospirochaeta perfilievii TaxID=252967 RepID=A0A5C1QFM9_9SPIO|nr:type 2 isopentenyl-diphosphate Delta-isomerase [Thiospirochaeta perfilievii]QEN05869.1 type 2 isopentenyl-diphosphate Delta-isomerase [Thiospirochaeta perfilievii]